jgi:acetylornithine deacetylase
LTERSGKLFGRGASDMKGFIAATLTSFSQIDLKSLKRPLVLVFTYDEEIGCKGSSQFVAKHRSLPDWYPKEALIGEPTDLRILRMHPGHVTFQVTVKGKAAHSSKPDLGLSAIKAASRVIGLLETLEQELMGERRLEEHLERPYVTLNIGIIQGGQAVNIVPDHCEILVGYRPLPGDDPRGVFMRFEEMLHNSDLSASSTLQTITPALLTQDGTPLKSLLVPHALGTHAGAAAFATDGGNLSTLGISCLIFGPGSMDVAHKADEFIEQEALRAAPKAIADIIRRRCA